MVDLGDLRYDFDILSKKYEYLRSYYINGVFQFSYDGQCALTKAILKDEFGIQVDIKKGHLIPSIPSRKTYLSILNSVITDSGIKGSVSGLDVGTGVYAIYAILGYKLYNWRMTGCDIDPIAITYAKELLHRNNLDEYVVVLKGDGIVDGEFTFMCCNPPFYESQEEIKKNDEFKEELKHEKVVATSNELVYEGGEVTFVIKLIDQSMKTKTITFYSSLIGQKKSIIPIIQKLDVIKCQNYFLKEYQLGQTKRWIIFWSFDNYRPIIPNNHKFITPTIIEFPINLSRIRAILSKLPLKIDSKDNIVIVTTDGDVWSRAFRRRGQPPNPAHRSIFIIKTDSIHWQYGPLRRIFQSFHTFIKKSL